MRSKGFPGSVPALAMIGFGALMGAFVPGTVSAAPGAHTYYVSPSGDDTANGWSKKTAWRTLSRVAQQRFIAGDRLLLEGGVVHSGSIAVDRATRRATSRSVRMGGVPRSSTRVIIQVS